MAWSKSAIWSLVLVVIAVALPILGILTIPGGEAEIANAIGFIAVVFLLLGLFLSILGIRNTKKFNLRGYSIAILALIICVIIGSLFLWEYLSN